MLNNMSCLIFGFTLMLSQILLSNAVWDHFVFTQQWPPAVCIAGEEEHKTCVIPGNVNTWVIHGLWPSEGQTKSPSNCNTSWPFREKDIKSIELRLDQYWPDLYVEKGNSSKFEFWSHEWSKHGTCATTLSATANETLYFSKGLQLQQQYDLHEIFADQGIKPSISTTYTLEQIYEAAKAGLGVSPVIMCMMNQTTKQQHIYEIEMCMTKSFEPIDCPNALKFHAGPVKTIEVNPLYRGNCPSKHEIYYQPIHSHY